MVHQRSVTSRLKTNSDMNIFRHEHYASQKKRENLSFNNILMKVYNYEIIIKDVFNIESLRGNLKKHKGMKIFNFDHLLPVKMQQRDQV